MSLIQLERRRTMKKRLLFVAVALFLSICYLQIVEAGTCVKQERYCEETLPDGKCKLWGTREVEVICGTDKKICTRQERYCEETLPDGKCKLWGSRTVEYPC